MGEIAENLRRVRERIAMAAGLSGRSADAVTLIAVSKTFPLESIHQAMETGQRHFGENRVQEAEPKIRGSQGIARLEWHLIGHLQTNKAKLAVELFEMIQSVDSLKLAAKLDEAGTAARKRLPILLQVRSGEEETKFGAEPKDVRALVAAISELKGLRLEGLMAIPPFFENPEDTRPYFAELRKLLDDLEAEQPGCLGQRHLSMGMSHDFEVAIREGSTMVRIGTAIFGARGLVR